MGDSYVEGGVGKVLNDLLLLFFSSFCSRQVKILNHDEQPTHHRYHIRPLSSLVIVRQFLTDRFKSTSQELSKIRAEANLNRSINRQRLKKNKTTTIIKS